MVVYWPPLQPIFHTVTLSFKEWQIIIALGILEIILVEVAKYYFLNKKRKVRLAAKPVAV